MVENELEKGFADLSALRAFLMAVGAAPGDRGNLAVWFLQNFTANDQKWGIWRPYLIQDQKIEDLSEDYRTRIRDLRVSVMSSQNPLSLQGSVAIAELDMRK